MVEVLGRGVGFLDHRRVLLGHLVHRADRLGNLAQRDALFAHGIGDAGDGLRHLADPGDDRLECGTGLVDQRDAGLDVSDRITLTLSGDDAVASAVTVHRDLIASETLAREISMGDVEGLAQSVGSGSSVIVSVAKV